MGRLRFVVPSRTRIVDGAISCAHMVGFDGIPWPGTVRLVESAEDSPAELVVERSINESGSFVIPWPVEGHGTIMLGTASLMERDQPYDLALELARGAATRVRNQLAEWEFGGLDVPDSVKQLVGQSTNALAIAVQATRVEQSADAAEAALKAAIDAGEQLVEAYCQQVLAVRKQQGELRGTMWGTAMACRELDAVPQEPLADAVNAINIPFCWRSIEPEEGCWDWSVCDALVDWCHDHQMHVLAGPLVCLDRCFQPEWVLHERADMQRLPELLLRFVDQVTDRYRGKITAWLCAARMNAPSNTPLADEQRLRLVLAALERVRRVDSSTPALVSFDQPFADYLSQESEGISPLQFADSLIRSNFGMIAIGLECNVGYWPGGTLVRDRLQWSQQLDRWSYLGLPLIPMMTAPSSDAPDDDAVCQPSPLAAGGSPPSPQFQRDVTARLARLFLAKHYVQGFFWSQLSDVQPHLFAHGGLFHGNYQPKPLLDVMQQIRREFDL